MSGFIVVAPFYNEEANIDLFLSRLSVLEEKISLQSIVLVDDGSSDSSVKKVEDFAVGSPVDLPP